MIKLKYINKLGKRNKTGKKENIQKMEQKKEKTSGRPIWWSPTNKSHESCRRVDPGSCYTPRGLRRLKDTIWARPI